MVATWTQATRLVVLSTASVAPVAFCAVKVTEPFGLITALVQRRPVGGFPPVRSKVVATAPSAVKAVLGMALVLKESLLKVMLPWSLSVALKVFAGIVTEVAVLGSWRFRQ